MDVKSAFLYGDITKEIYMEKPQGFVQYYSLVCRLQLSLYDLKQAPWAWYEKMDSFLLSTGFTHYHFNPTMYIQHLGDEILILVLYVDDLILTSSSSYMLQDVQRVLMDQFQMIDLGFLYYFLGLQIVRSSIGIFFLITLTGSTFGSQDF